MKKQHNENTSLCNRYSCRNKRTCIHFTAMIDHRNRKYINERDNLILGADIPQYGTDCLHSSGENYCEKRNTNICQMECNNCEDYIRRGE